MPTSEKVAKQASNPAAIHRLLFTKAFAHSALRYFLCVLCGFVDSVVLANLHY
jgi:hypothetical protein